MRLIFVDFNLELPLHTVELVDPSGSQKMKNGIVQR